MKMVRFFAFLVLGVGVLLPTAGRASGGDITLLLVPRDEVPVRIGMDVGNRFPTLLVSYKVLSNGSLSLHGWSGTEWVNISPASYQAGGFFQTSPSCAVIVTQPGQVLPGTLVPAEAWCPTVYKIDATDARVLLHLIGRLCDFRFKDWKWFAENYQLSLDSINPEGLNIAWYQKQLKDNVKQPEDAVMTDLQHLMVVRTPQVIDEPVAEEELETPEELMLEQADVAEPAVVPAADDADAIDVEIPLTNAVPEAVILGAGGAEEPVAESADEPEVDLSAENME